MIGSVGNDDNGRKIIYRMNELGIDTSRIELVDTETGNAMINAVSYTHLRFKWCWKINFIKHDIRDYRSRFGIYIIRWK